jgi:hypothetical protein
MQYPDVREFSHTGSFPTKALGKLNKIFARKRLKPPNQ